MTEREIEPTSPPFDDSEAPELDTDALRAITKRTIEHYDDKAQVFWEGTRGHDVEQNRSTLLKHLQQTSPPAGGFCILDLGCGPGRDLIAFKELGYQPTGLDGSLQFCKMARTLSGCEVLHQDMLAMNLPSEHFHGVFANASLFHVPAQELPRVLGELRRALVPAGVLFTSNPRGDNVEGWRGDRYGSFHDHTRWTALVTAAGFSELEHYYRPPGKPRALQPWLATAFRKL